MGIDHERAWSCGWVREKREALEAGGRLQYSDAGSLGCGMARVPGGFARQAAVSERVGNDSLAGPG